MRNKKGILVLLAQEESHERHNCLPWWGILRILSLPCALRHEIVFTIASNLKMRQCFAGKKINLVEKERNKDSFTNTRNLVIIRKEQKISSERKEIYAKRTYDQICRSGFHCR